MNETIKEITNYLFDCDFFDDNFDVENNEVHLDKAQELLASYSWQEIVDEWLNYLYSNLPYSKRGYQLCESSFLL